MAGRGMGGSAPSGGAAGSACSPADSGVVIPTPTGRVDPRCNDVGIDGYWFAFADGYADEHGEASCLDPGLHMLTECSVFLTPDPGRDFTNMNGVMRTVGTVAQIIPCVDGVTGSGCPANDYENIWGAGIGLTFNTGASGEPAPWDPSVPGVVGVRFTIDQVPEAGLRIEFPMLLTDEEAAAADPPLPSGSTTEDTRHVRSPYWGAQAAGDGKFPNSPVAQGTNMVLWTDVSIPKLGVYTWDPARLLGIRFHVPTTTVAARAYNFSISNVTFVRQP